MTPNQRLHCPSCGFRFAMEAAREGDHMNCPRCRQVFEGTLNDRLATLHLWAHPALPSADAYPELAVHGIHPNSSMDDVQEVFAETTAEKDAVEILRRVPSRLVADLFMAPLEDEEDADGS